MKKLIHCSVIALMALLLSSRASALLNIELTRWANNAIPIAILPLAGQSNNAQAPDNIATVIQNDLQNSGRFRVANNNKFTQTPTSPELIDLHYWRNQSLDYMTVGKVQNIGNNQYRVDVALVGVYPTKDDAKNQQILFSKEYTIPQTELRSLAHHISDMIYQGLVGIPGIFSTRLAYVVVKRNPGQPTKYVLEVSDVDGYNPQPLLTSSQPIMSPAWSPNSKKLAYVSYENGYPRIYVQEVASGARRLITSFPGINGAPAWSPDGKKLAVVLSKASGNPKIYTVDLGSGQLSQLTTGYSIDTEPDWSPEGSSIIFTSDRGGGPQIYRIDLASGQIQRITFSGNYNARATYSPDGKSIVMMHQDEEGNFDIAEQNLAHGTIKLLTRAKLDESPTLSPNGEMVLYSSDAGARVQLAIVSTDGRVKLQLPTREGDVQSPAWSSFVG